jgi:GntR family transcriptional regulator
MYVHFDSTRVARPKARPAPTERCRTWQTTATGSGAPAQSTGPAPCRYGFRCEPTSSAACALVEQYAVSRHTVREALRRLRQTGLVDAARGRAPKVAGHEITQPQGTLYSLFSSVEASGQQQRSIVRTLDARADGTVAFCLGLEESTPLIYLERIRLADEEPLAMDRVWIPARLAAPLLDADFTQTSLYRELDHRCGIRLTGGHEQVRAVIPTAAERVLLEIPESSAALAIDRIGELRGQPVEWRQSVVRGDRFSLHTDFTGPDTISMAVSMTVSDRQHATSQREPR